MGCSAMAIMSFKGMFVWKKSAKFWMFFWMCASIFGIFFIHQQFGIPFLWEGTLYELGF